MAAKEQAVEKGGFPLREVEVTGELGNELGDRGHWRKTQFTENSPGVK
jgi:hypothetical protein